MDCWSRRGWALSRELGSQGATSRFVGIRASRDVEAALPATWLNPVR